MTTLTFFKMGDKYMGFRCMGHSNYADEGEDIVCAAISSVVQYDCEYFDTYHSDIVDIAIDENTATIQVICKMWHEDIQKLLAVLCSFATQLKEQYPDNFNFEFTEVY